MSDIQHINESTPKFGGTAIYVDDVSATLDFYRRALGFETRFFDEAFAVWRA